MNTQFVRVAAKIQVASVKYRQYHFFAAGVNDTGDGSPVFGQAVAFVSLPLPGD